MSPKISVIITTKNRKQFLQETINAFLKQTIKPLEIIVVDDHSTDGTIDMLKAEYSHSIKLVENERGGLSAGRNIGFDNAKGDFIKIFDDDDLLTSNSLEVQFNELIKSGREFIYSPYVKAKFDQGWQQIDRLMHFFPLPSFMSVQKFMVKGGILVLPSCLFTKRLIDKTGPYNENIVTYEDWDYLWRLGKNEPYPAHTNQTLMVYRQHGFQMTNGMLNQDLINKDRVSIFNSALKDVCANSDEFSYLDKCYMQYHIYKTFEYIEDKEFIVKMANSKPKLFLLHSLLYRLENKYQRLKSKSEWTTWHGVLNKNVNSILEEINAL